MFETSYLDYQMTETKVKLSIEEHWLSEPESPNNYNSNNDSGYFTNTSQTTYHLYNCEPMLPLVNCNSLNSEYQNSLSNEYYYYNNNNNNNQQSEQHYCLNYNTIQNYQLDYSESVINEKIENSDREEDLLNTANKKVKSSLNNSDVMDGTLKRKRKRVLNQTQRVEATQREKRRMLKLNKAFEELRKVLPISEFAKNKLSRAETLKSTIEYIERMSQLLTI